MIVSIENYTKVIKKQTVLEDVALRFESGSVYCLRGRNGSGKTMLLRAVAGLIKPTSGRVVVDGEVIGTDREFPASLGLLIENPCFVANYTGFQNLKLVASIKGEIDDDAIEKVLRRVGLDPGDKRPFKKYSLGMKQRLGIACAIMEKPDLILLDEPLNSLDDEGIELAKTIIREEADRGALVVVASHDVSDLQGVVDSEIYLAGGKVQDKGLGHS